MDAYARASSWGDSNDDSFPFWNRGGRFLAYFLGAGTAHGKNTPVPPRGDILPPGLGGEVVLSGSGAGASTMIGLWRANPQAVGITAAGQAAMPAAGASGAGGSGELGCRCARNFSAVGESVWWVAGRTLMNVMITLLLGDEQTTCRAISALFPRITSSVLQQQISSQIC